MKAVSTAPPEHIHRERGPLEQHEAVYIIFLALLASVPPLATDMYLGAIPIIAKLWQVRESVVGLSLVLWFAAFSVSLLVCGPASDKYARRPVLISGLALFVVSSFLCSTAANTLQLILYRVLQGMGAACPSSMCMAICRDLYDGERRKRALAYVGTILAVVPMIAPSVGVTVLKVSNWRMIFIAQGGLASVTLLISFAFRETIGERFDGGMLAAMGRYANLVRNRGFVLANSAMGLIVGPHFGFIAFSPLAYMQAFGLSPHAFSLLFGFNATMLMLGAFTCARLSHKYRDTLLLTGCITGAVIGTIGILIFGPRHYMALAGCMAVFSFCGGMSRPLSNNLVLGQVDTDIGSASSLIVFYQFMVGAVAMAISTASWRHPVHSFGVMSLCFAGVVFLLWPLLLRVVRPAR